MKLFNKFKSIGLTICFILMAQLAFAHVTEIRVNQNTDGTLTWYLQTYHSVNECGFSGAGIRINGISYGINSTHVGSITGLSPTILAQHSGISWGRSSYAIVNTPYIAGNLNVVPYSNNVCWDFLVGGNGSFTPPPPPVCTTPPVTSVSNTLGTPNNNNTDCIVTDDTIPVTLNISHLACGNITGDGQLSVFYSDGTLIGNVAYQNGISTPYTFNLPQGKLAQLTIVDNDFPNSPFNYTINGLNGTSYTGATNITPITPVLSDVNGQCNVSVPLATTTDNCGGTINGTTSDPLSYSVQGQYTITWTFDAGNGNSTTATQNVTVKDTVFPSITSPFDIVTNADPNECGAFVTYGIPTANDNCGTGAVPTTLANHTYKGMLNGHSYFISNTVSTPEAAHANAIAAGGHLVTISDAAENLFVSGFNTGRIWIGHTDRDVEGQWKWISNEPVTYTNWASGEPNNWGGAEDWAVINWSGSNPDWNDWYFNASAYYAIEFDGGTLPTTLVSGPASGDLFPVGTTTVTYEAVDPAGNRVETSFNITVNDNISPEITAPANISVSATSAAGAIVNYIAPVATDNCEVTTVFSSGLVDGATFPLGTTTVTYTATDASGNTAVASFNVEVVGIAPEIVVPTNISVSNDEGICGAVVNYTATETTGIPASTITYDIQPGSLFTIGSVTVTATATNAVGTSTKTFTVNVNDNEAPTAIAKDISIDLDANGFASITPAMIDNGSFDACGIESILFAGSGTFNATTNEGNNLVLQAPLGSVIDGITFSSYGTPNNNAGTFTIGSCHASNSLSIVESYALGKNSVTIPAVNGLFGDPCGGTYKRLYVTATYSAETTTADFTCANVGNNQVTLLVTDINGNIATATANVTVNDITAPIVLTRDITVELDANGVASITTSMIDNGSSDACGIETYTLDVDNFTCENVGTNTVILSVKDNNGNVASLNATVTVKDTVAPNVITQNITVELDANGVASITPLMIDNGSSDACGIETYTLDIDNFTCANVGTNTVILSVKDNNGNVASLNATVTVKDTVAPNVITQNITVELDANGVASITTSMIDNGSSDACGIESYTLDIDNFTCANVGANTVILSVKDNNGNVASLNATVTVKDTVAPNVITQNITVELDANGVTSITPLMIDNGSSDACGIETYTLDIDNFTCANVGTNTVILSVKDNNGNVASLNATVTVKDTVAPNVITQNITVELDANGVASITTSMIDNGSSDACGIETYTLDIDNFTCANVGANTVILSVKDNNGNVASLNATVTVKDTVAPNVITQNITVELDANGVASITPLMIDNGSSDACGIESYTLDVDNFTCENVGTNNVILSVKDNNGNVASLNATVTVQDNIAPTVITKTFSIDLANGVANITPSDINGGTFDNCAFTLSIDKDSFSCDDIGNHVVTLTAVDPSGNTSSNTAIVSILGNVPTISINDFNAVNTQKENTIFLGFGPQSVNLSTVVSGGSGFTYQWTTSSGEVVSNQANPAINPTVSTTYNVTVTNSNGCTASTSIYICVIDARDFDKKGRDTGKVTVCHHTNGKKGTKHVEINISANAVMTHLTQHGVGTDHADSLGACNAVCVSDSNAKTSTKQKEVISSIEDNLLIYPNPSIGVFEVKLTSVNLQTELYLFDTTGKLIQHKSISKENSSGDIITMGNYNLASGFYFLKIINKNESLTKKLIIEKSK